MSQHSLRGSSHSPMKWFRKLSKRISRDSQVFKDDSHINQDHDQTQSESEVTGIGNVTSCSRKVHHTSCTSMNSNESVKDIHMQDFTAKCDRARTMSLEVPTDCINGKSLLSADVVHLQVDNKQLSTYSLNDHEHKAFKTDTRHVGFTEPLQRCKSVDFESNMANGSFHHASREDEKLLSDCNHNKNSDKENNLYPSHLTHDFLGSIIVPHPRFGVSKVRDSVLITPGYMKNISLGLLHKDISRRQGIANAVKTWFMPSTTAINLKLFGGKKAVQIEQERAREAGMIIHPCSRFR